MTHPTREELVEFLYGELPAERQSSIDAHVQSCRPCADQLQAWRGAKTQMNTWKIPTGARRRESAPVMAWAAAAAVLGLGVAVGVLGFQVKELRGQLAKSQASVAELARSEAQGAVTALEARYQQERAADQRTYLAALQQLQTQQAQSYAGLRKELETVAVLTEAGLQQAHLQIATISNSPRTEDENSQQE